MKAVELKEYGYDFRDLYLGLMSTVFGKAASDRKRFAWDWLFQNPTGATRIFVIEKHGVAIGASIIVPTELVIAGTRHAALLPSTTMVHPDHRGAGLRVIAAYYDRDKEKLKIGQPNTAKHRQVHTRRGAVASPTLGMRKRVFRPGTLLRIRKGVPGLFAVPIDLLGVCTTALSRLAHPRLRQNEEIKQLSEFGPEFDQAWSNIETQVVCAQARTARFLQWRYVDMPFVDYTRFGLFRDGVLQGYAVANTADVRDLSIGRVSDTFCYSGQERDYALLLSAADDLFRARSCVQAEIVFGRSDAVDRGAWRAGYLFRKFLKPVSVIPSQHVEADMVQSSISDIHLCRGDLDDDY